MLRRSALVIAQVLVVVGLTAGPATAQETTTTTSVGWQPVTTPARSSACAWEWGGQVEVTPARCDDLGEVTLPVWLLVAAGLGVLLASAGLVATWRR